MRRLLAFALMLTVAGVALAHDLSNTMPAKPDDTTVYVEPDTPRQGGNTIAEAVPITIPGTYYGTTTGYSNNYDEVCPFSGSTAPDVVYSVTPANDIMADFDLCYSSYDTKLYIYDANMALVGCNDDFHYSGNPFGCYVYSSKLEQVSLTAGMTYYVIVDGYGSSNGDYQLDVTEFFPPAPLECPPGAEEEGEPPLGPDYEDTYNGGCNTDPANPPFQPITQPLFCGMTGFYTYFGSNYRDTDWFHVEIPASGQLIVTAEAEMPTVVYELWPQDCASVAVAQSMTVNLGQPGTMIINGTPGSTIWLFVGAAWPWQAIDPWMYVLELNIAVATEDHTWSSVKSIFQ